MSLESRDARRARRVLLYLKAQNEKLRLISKTHPNFLMRCRASILVGQNDFSIRLAENYGVRLGPKSQPATVADL
jgi:hypothetical protein